MIYTIFTGGTIGSIILENGRVGTDSPDRYTLLELYRESGGDGEFVTARPYNALSETLDGEKLNLLAQAVSEGLKTDCEGIIVTHGTDTLQYSAAILGYLFSGAEVPIVLVSANYILSDSRSNGLENFRGAVDFIKSGSGKGVFVSYQNTGSVCVIHRACRLIQSEVFTDDVKSIFGQSFGRIEGRAFIPSENYSVSKTDSDLFSPSSPLPNLKNADGAVMWVKACVCPSIALTGKTKAILLESYHSGTVNTEALSPLLLEAERRKIPVFLTGLAEDATNYETLSQYASLGIIPLRNKAPISQYCKLLLLIAAGMDITENMSRDCAGELP